jgi:hypothetical protein
MTEPTETILEKRGYFWWDGEKASKGRYVPMHGVPGVLTIREDGKTRLNVTASLLQSKALGLTSPDRNKVDGDRERFKGRCIAGVIDGQGRSVYLKKLICRSFGREIGGKGSEEFESDLCIVGNTATTRAEASLRFSRLSISLAGLEDWRRGDLLVAGDEKADGVNRSRDVVYTDTPIEYELKDEQLPSEPMSTALPSRVFHIARLPHQLQQIEPHPSRANRTFACIVEPNLLDGQGSLNRGSRFLVLIAAVHRFPLPLQLLHVLALDPGWPRPRLKDHPLRVIAIRPE